MQLKSPELRTRGILCVFSVGLSGEEPQHGQLDELPCNVSQQGFVVADASQASARSGGNVG